MMMDHEFDEAMDSQRTLLAKRDQYAEQVKRHEYKGEIAEALEAEKMAGECLFEVLQLAQKVGEAQWEELQAVRAERDTLAAELVALRAGLPRWKPVYNKLSDDSPLFLCLKLAHFTLRTLHLPATEAECAAACVELGLPPCEVEGE